MNRKIVGALSSMAVATALVLSGAMAASATTTYPEGGTWNYGVRSGGIYGSGGQVYSEYQHTSRTHKATACGYGGCAYSGWKSPSALASAYWSPMASSGNNAYYDVQ
ncbi:lactococcin 972 family bacteriocin [Cryobacterium shii]|uniref:Lactococcin 972 family bacteriocin n=1 Tax=Cryobacterium shii TaxID=1259235 RepID=A0AAQ2HFU2_9MICO|nr:lactococcin 972 family bacteriocin [Cryobacterium shii]TFC48916.1 lactococcin 972 family bacteriocin [Cryobacterium shii]